MMYAEIKEFADKQLKELREDGKEPKVTVYCERLGKTVVDPWMDAIERFPLTTPEARGFWGDELFKEFCRKAEEAITGKPAEDPARLTERGPKTGGRYFVVRRRP